MGMIYAQRAEIIGRLNAFVSGLWRARILHIEVGDRAI
jgi:hypothetical protein